MRHEKTRNFSHYAHTGREFKPLMDAPKTKVPAPKTGEGRERIEGEREKYNQAGGCASAVSWRAKSTMRATTSAQVRLPACLAACEKPSFWAQANFRVKAKLSMHIQHH